MNQSSTRYESRLDSTSLDESPPGDESELSTAGRVSERNGREVPGTSLLPGALDNHRASIERECHSLADLADNKLPKVQRLTVSRLLLRLQDPPQRKNTEVITSDVPLLAKRAANCHSRLQPSNLLAKVRSRRPQSRQRKQQLAISVRVLFVPHLLSQRRD